MSSWTERMHRRAATLGNVVTSCGHPSSVPPYPRRLEKLVYCLRMVHSFSLFCVLIDLTCESTFQLMTPSETLHDHMFFLDMYTIHWHVLLLEIVVTHTINNSKKKWLMEILMFVHLSCTYHINLYVHAVQIKIYIQIFGNL